MGDNAFKDKIQSYIQKRKFMSDVRVGTEHDLSRHTNQSNTDMINRIFAEDKQIISAFHTTESVDELIRSSVLANLDMLELKFNNAEEYDKISISYAFDHKIGTAIQNKNNKLQGIDTNMITVVFTKDETANSVGLRLTTAYPGIDRTQCPGVKLTRHPADLIHDIQKTKKYQTADALEKACLENMCDLNTARSYMTRNSHTGDTCCVKSNTEKLNYFIEINGYNHNLRTEKQNRTTYKYLPVIPCENSRKTWQNVTPELDNLFRQKLPKLITTVDHILARCNQLQQEKTIVKQRNADELLADIDYDTIQPEL